MSSHSAPIADSSAPSGTPASRIGTGPVGILIRVAVAVAILFAANLVPAAFAGLVMMLPGAADVLGGGMSPLGFILTLLMQALVLVAVVAAVWAWMRWIERSPIAPAGWRWGRRSVLWLPLGIAVSAGTVLAVTALLPDTGPVRSDKALGLSEPTPAVIAMLIVYYLGLGFLQQGIPEELLFRGWLAWRLRERPVVAVVVTTAAFAVIHLVSQGGQQNALEHVLYLALPLGFALLASGLMLWTGSLWAAVGVHGGFHLGNYASMAFLPETDAVTSWLAVGAAQAALGLVLVITALRRGRRILDGRD